MELIYILKKWNLYFWIAIIVIILSISIRKDISFLVLLLIPLYYFYKNKLSLKQSVILIITILILTILLYLIKDYSLIDIFKAHLYFKNNLRELISNFIKSNYDTKVSGLIRLLLFNESSSDILDFKNNLLNMNIYFLITVSGSQLYLLEKLINKIFRKHKNSQIAFLLFLSIYTYFTRFSIATIRILLYKLTKFIFKKKLSGWNILGISLFLNILINSKNIINSGFLMSYYCTICARVYLTNFKNFLIEQIYINFIFFIFSFPFCLMFDKNFSLISIFYCLFFSWFFNFYFLFFLICWPLTFLNNLFLWMSNFLFYSIDYFSCFNFRVYINLNFLEISLIILTLSYFIIYKNNKNENLL